MLASSFLVTLVGLVSFSTAGYVLEDDYSVDQFFSMFDFFTDADPTNGYVQYVDQNTAQGGGLINTNNNAVYMGVDHTNVASGSGRQSVRLTSKKSYTHGLIVLDLSHMPGGVCGTWPAFWTVGPNWPNAGEIDIIEGVNSQLANSMTLHTGSGCSITNNGMFSGSISTQNCNIQAAGQATNAGCQILTPNTASYGNGFNQGQGGVYATEWTSDHISIWFFPRSAIPSDISSGTPDPSNWGQPMATFAGGCNIDQFFNNNQIVFDTTFCGDWAGNVWTSDPVCGSKAPTCQNFVQNNPSAFQDAYWSVNSLKVYQSSGGASASSSGIPFSSSGIPFSIPSQAPTASVSIPSGLPSGIPPSGIPPVIPTTSEPIPTTGFSRGGNGRHTKTFGTWGANFVAETSSPSPSSSVSFDARAPSVTVGPPLAVTVAPDGSVGEVDEGGSSASPPEITPTAAPSPAIDDAGDENVKYVTVSALGDDYFHEKSKRNAISEPELAIEPRSIPEMAVTGKVEEIKRDLSKHRHDHGHRNGNVHRHLFRHGAAGAVGKEE